MKDFTIESGLKAIINPGTGIAGRGTHASSKLQETGTKPFIDTLAESLEKVNKMQLEADQAIEDFATGKTRSIHEVMTTLSKADIAFRLTVQVRNKVVEGYQEIMRMAV